MMFCKYEFPNPNNGERYDLSMKELTDLLDKVYQNGWDHARAVYDPAMQPKLTVASSIEDVDDNTKWREVWIK